EQLDLDGTGVAGRLHVPLPLPHVDRAVADLAAAVEDALRQRGGPVGELEGVDTAARTGPGDLLGRPVVPPDVVRVDRDADLVGREAFREVQGLAEGGDHAAV